MRYAYPCVLNSEEEGGFFVVFPDVPGALTGWPRSIRSVFAALPRK